MALINSAPVKKSESARLNDLISVKERELAKIARYKQSIYQDWKDGALTRQEYMDMKADYDSKADELRRIAEYIQINTDKPGQAAGKSA